MKTAIKISIILCAIGLIYILDYNNRFKTELNYHYSEEESNFFFNYKTIEESQDSIKSNWNKKKYKFPRTEIAKIEYNRNLPILGQLMKLEISDNHSSELIEIINDPENFDWTETTWNRKESKYYFKFFDQKENEVCRFWVMDEEYGMSEIVPWIPTTKYGSLSKIGSKKLNELIGKITK